MSASFRSEDRQDNIITFFKRDIEMRFKCLGIQWTNPTSVSFIRDYQAIQITALERITDIKCYVFAALDDGYWQDASPANILPLPGTMKRYERSR
jgi:hypothetical protein